MIVRARLKAARDLAVMIGWQSRRFHYQKTLDPLPDYLKPPLSPAEKREQGAKKVRAMFERMKRKGTADGPR